MMRGGGGGLWDVLRDKMQLFVASCFVVAFCVAQDEEGEGSQMWRRPRFGNWNSHQN